MAVSRGRRDSTAGQHLAAGASCSGSVRRRRRTRRVDKRVLAQHSKSADAVALDGSSRISPPRSASSAAGVSARDPRREQIATRSPQHMGSSSNCVVSQGSFISSKRAHADRSRRAARRDGGEPDGSAHPRNKHARGRRAPGDLQSAPARRRCSCRTAARQLDRPSTPHSSTMRGSADRGGTPHRRACRSRFSRP